MHSELHHRSRWPAISAGRDAFPLLRDQSLDGLWSDRQILGDNARVIRGPKPLGRPGRGWPSIGQGPGQVRIWTCDQEGERLDVTAQ